VRPFEFDEKRLSWLPLSGIAITIITWGMASPLIKLADVGGPALSFHRLWIGAAMLLAALYGSGERLSARSLRWAVPAGAIFGINMVLFVVSVKMTTVANATLIGALQPAITLLVAGRWFGEAVTRRAVACVGAAIGGVAIVIVGSAGSPEWNPVGDALAVCAVLSFTGYFLISKRARASLGTLEYMTGVHVAAALVAMPLALFNPADLWQLGPADVGIVLFIAFVSGTGGQVVIGWAQRFVDVTVSSLMLLGVPVVAALAAWAILGEALGPIQAVGGAITLVAIAAMVRQPARATEIDRVGEPAVMPASR
jgi:drug/metabolite transporter (DMT)-like permease